jgi:Flp pilus assembly protein TadB
MSLQNISVFEPQDINGEIIEPLCIPAMQTAVAHTVAGATNLLWFSFHLCLAERNKREAARIARMLQVVVDEETAEGFAEQLQEAINLLDEPLGNEYSSGDE